MTRRAIRASRLSAIVVRWSRSRKRYERQGILAVDVRDPRTGAVYPAGTAIPMTSFARSVLAGLPDPNVAGAANNYSILQDFTNHSNKAGGKIDLRPSATVSLDGDARKIADEARQKWWTAKAEIDRQIAAHNAADAVLSSSTPPRPARSRRS